MVRCATTPRGPSVLRLLDENAGVALPAIVIVRDAAAAGRAVTSAWWARRSLTVHHRDAPMARLSLRQIAFQPLAGASVLTLLIAAVGVHLALHRAGPGAVRAGGVYRANAFSNADIRRSGRSPFSGQADFGGGAVTAVDHGWDCSGSFALHAVRQGVACDGGQPAGSAPGRHRNRAFRPDRVSCLAGAYRRGQRHPRSFH